MGAIKATVISLYEADFHAWALQQAAALRDRRTDELDYGNLIEEIESMGKQQRAELRNRLVVLLTHLLQLDAQPSMKDHHRSWSLSILEQRSQLEDHVSANPSLAPYIDEAVRQAFKTARVVAARETDLPLRSFPMQSPYSYREAMTRPLHED